MRFALFIGILLVAAILIRSFATDDDGKLLERIDALEAETARLASDIARLQRPEPPPAAEADSSSGTEHQNSAPNWRLGAGLDGKPISIVEKTFDKASARVEALVRIEAPLADLAAWPSQPGQPLPILLEARDIGGGIALQQPMTLLRGTRLEPGAYLHIGADLPPEVASRLGLLQLRLEPPQGTVSTTPP